MLEFSFICSLEPRLSSVSTLSWSHAANGRKCCGLFYHVQLWNKSMMSVFYKKSSWSPFSFSSRCSSFRYRQDLLLTTGSSFPQLFGSYRDQACSYGLMPSLFSGYPKFSEGHVPARVHHYHLLEVSSINSQDLINLSSEILAPALDLRPLDNVWGFTSTLYVVSMVVGGEGQLRCM